MRAKHGTFAVVVDAIETVTPLIKTFRLVDPDGEPLPGFSGGSHVIVIIGDGERVYRNPYSLIGSPFDTRSYEIAVGFDANGRGGSATMHHRVKVGDRLEITYPANQFPLDRLAKKHVLIAGGVGITPFLAHLHELAVATTPFELHYGVRSQAHAGLFGRIAPDLRKHSRIYPGDEQGRPDFASILSGQPVGAHVYICGPRGMLDAARAEAERAGWPDSHIHFELFDQQTTGQPFSVFLAASDMQVDVPPEMSLLEAAEAKGISIPYLCRGGACGYCETEVIACEGELIHRDIWLSAADRQANKKFMPCVSRALCSKLILNA